MYTVRNDNDLDEVYSGTMSIFFKCYEPFGKMAYTSYDTFGYIGFADSFFFSLQRLFYVRTSNDAMAVLSDIPCRKQDISLFAPSLL